MGGATLSLKGTETILVAEDEDGVRSLTREVLEKYGYRVLEAANGEEALAVADQHQGPLDLLLSDVVMPRMGGPELAQALLQRRPTVPIERACGARVTSSRAERYPSSPSSCPSRSSPWPWLRQGRVRMSR